MTFLKLFECQKCGQATYFENRRCERCESRLGYLPESFALTALAPTGQLWTALCEEAGRAYRFCDNAGWDACNWLVPADSKERFCIACRHNHTIPDLGDPRLREAWRQLEFAKHRLFYSLLALHLPLASRAESKTGLAFDFLAERPGGPKVLTGHDDGLVTLNLQEADDAERERLRREMGEPYRTLLGHFRHEVGHYFWDVLVRDGGRLEEFRACFGDERADYNEALKAHYRNGPPADWQQRCISAYATSHPWEDFAETWAHYLHIVDTLEMARALGITVAPGGEGERARATDFPLSPYDVKDSATLVNEWLPLESAVNNLNRCMGQPDLYPFILSAPVVEKLGFIHRLVHDQM